MFIVIFLTCSVLQIKFYCCQYFLVFCSPDEITLVEKRSGSCPSAAWFFLISNIFFTIHPLVFWGQFWVLRTIQIVGSTFCRLLVKEKLRFSIVKKRKIVSRHLTLKKTFKKTVTVVNKTGILWK